MGNSPFLCDLHANEGIFGIGGHLPPMDSPRANMAPGGPRYLKFGIQVDFGLFYHPVLEFLESEVIYLRYDLREKIWLPEDLLSSNSVHR